MDSKLIQKYFAVLGLTPDATEAEVREARNFATKAYHPDKYAQGSSDQRKAQQKQVEINEAYEQLTRWFAVSADSLSAGQPVSATPQANSSTSTSTESTSRNQNRTQIFFALKICLFMVVSIEWGTTAWSWYSAGNVSLDLPLGLVILTTLALIWLQFAPEAKAFFGCDES